VVAPTREGHEEVDEALAYEVFRLPGSYLRATNRVYRGIVEAAKEHGPDVIHFLATLPLGRLGPRLRRALDVPFTVVAHGTGEILLPSRLPIARRALRKVLKQADLVLANSEFTKGHVDRITKGGARTAILNPSVDTERFSLDVSGGDVRAELGVGGAFVVLFVSRLVKRKGCDALLRAVAGVQEAVLVVVGSGPEQPSLERLTRELDVSDRVVFAGQVPDDKLPEYYAAADTFCMPCTDRYGGLDTEGFGVVYLEAQATGLPVVAGRCGGSAEAVEHGVTGVVLDEPTPRSVAVALVHLHRDPALAVRLGGAGRARMEREFAPGVLAQRLDELLRDTAA
jgi:phosphatidylinositol alpha-1,6-mannosyltransferase